MYSPFLCYFSCLLFDISIIFQTSPASGRARGRRRHASTGFQVAPFNTPSLSAAPKTAGARARTLICHRTGKATVAPPPLPGQCKETIETIELTGSHRVNNTQFRNTLNKAKTLCDKFRASGGIGSNHRLSLDGTLPDQANQANQGKLSRWFSIRRGSTHQYDIENVDGKASPGTKMPLLPEVEEENAFNCSAQQRRQVPPTLPPPPQNLTPQQLKRRMIVAAIVHSENSYVATLQRLVNVST